MRQWISVVFRIEAYTDGGSSVWQALKGIGSMDRF